MKLFTTILIFIYTIIFLVIGTFFLAIAFKLTSITEIAHNLEYIYGGHNLRLITAMVGCFLIIINIFLAQITLGKFQREKTIAFNNPSGQVTIALSAIEDFIKRLPHHVPELKELKSEVIAGKKGVEINARVSLWAGVNIPDATEKIQEIIKSRIQDILGIEEAIVVKVHVAKIIQPEENKESKKKEEPTIPFRGIEYRAD